MTGRYRSEALAAAHEAALGLAEAGLMSKRTVREFDEMCLTSEAGSPPGGDAAKGAALPAGGETR